ncbi:aldo/keto reductase [Streptomyces sp. NPDC059687]|uniref:aldo/keto reductase n=1 Tax=unclassified Streptomyces TaxID=2593676 RepID=UPI00343A086B
MGDFSRLVAVVEEVGVVEDLTHLDAAIDELEDTTRKTEIVDAVLDVAAELDVPASHVAIAWMRHQGAQAATAYVPIIGPRSVAQLDNYLSALDATLTQAQFVRLDEVSAIRLGTPHELNAWSVSPIRGGDASMIDEPAIPVA